MSTGAQIKGDSLRRQLELSSAFAAKRALALDNSLRDIGVSGFGSKNRETGALGRFLSMVDSDAIAPGSYLLVESLDRLSRDDVMAALPVFLAIVNAGIVIVTLADEQEYSRESINQNWTQLVVSLAIMSRAHEESLQKSKRLCAAWEHKRRMIAERKLTARAPGWLELAPERDRFVIVEERVAVVIRIFDETLAGIGQHKIAARLNAEGVPTFGAGNGWHGSAIQKILDGTAVLGTYQPCRKEKGKRVPEGDPIENYFPAVIDEALYQRAQQARKARRRGSAGRKGLAYSNLLTGLCRCAECGASMVYRNKGMPPKGGIYLLCGSAMRRQGCANRRHYRHGDLEDAVLNWVVDLDLRQALPDELRDLETRVAVLAFRRKAIVAKVTALLNQFEDDPIPLVAERIRERQDEIHAIDSESGALEERLNRYLGVGTPGDRGAAIAALRARIAKADAAERYAIRAKIASALRSIVDLISFSESGSVDVVIIGGVKAYRFVGGQLVNSIDLRPLLDVPGGIPSLAFTFGHPDRVERLRRFVSNAERADDAVIAIEKVSVSGAIR
jgi:DNA invertase Pin-like site-specific DNA recombinase